MRYPAQISRKSSPKEWEHAKSKGFMRNRWWFEADHPSTEPYIHETASIHAAPNQSGWLCNRTVSIGDIARCSFGNIKLDVLFFSVEGSMVLG